MHKQAPPTSGAASPPTDGSSATPAAESAPTAAAEKLADGLAEVIIDSCFGRPLDELLPPLLLSQVLRPALIATLRSPRADELLASLVTTLTDSLRSPTTLLKWCPPPLLTLLRQLAKHPYTPDRALLLTVMSQPACRRLMRELMVGTLLDYGRKLRTATSDGSAGKGLGALSRLAGEAMKKGSGAFSALAPGVASAVADEFDRQLQKRAADFADGAVDELLGKMAAILTDPQRRAAQEELKLALLEAVLSLRGTQLASELTRVQPVELGKLVRTAALAWLERDEAAAELTSAWSFLIQQAHGRSLRDLLGEAAVLLPTRAAARQLLSHLLRPVVASGSLLSILSSPAALR